MTEDRKRSSVTKGDVVQISLESTLALCFKGCLMFVEEVKSWGVQGFILAPMAHLTKDDPPDGIFLRVEWKDLERVGSAAWMVDPLA